jgi:hypothetical protein
MSNKRFALTQGRSLKFAPDWSCSDASVVFDAHSGDYWVVSLLGSGLLKLFQTQGEMTLSEVSNQMSVSALGVDGATTLQSTLQSLADNRLLQAVNWPDASEHSKCSTAD